MKKMLLLSVTFFIAATMYAQTSTDAIIGSYIQAIGGREKLSQINSLHIESTMQIMGNDAQNVTTILNGKGYKSEVSINGQQIVQSVTDKGGWMINPYMNMTDPTPMNADTYNASKERIYTNGLLFNYSTTGHRAQLKGMDKVGDNNCYMIEVTSPDNIKSVYYIDSVTHFIDKLIFDEGGPVETTIVYSNYKKTDFGNMFPFTQELTPPQQNMSFTVNITKVEINKPVDPSIFEMPKK